jgi:hypothetical protein
VNPTHLFPIQVGGVSILSKTFVAPVHHLSFTCLQQYRNKPLERHIATVAEFLWKCSKANNDEKSELLYTFHRAMSSAFNTLMPQTLQQLI